MRNTPIAHFNNKKSIMETISKPTTKTSVNEAAQMAFSLMEMRFSAIEFINEVRDLAGRPYLMDGTIMRALRQLRQDYPNSFGYQVIDYDKAIYLKSI